MSHKDNRERIFEDLVGVDTYYTRFTKKKSDLMLYIAFNEANFGGNPNDEVSFTLKLRAAKFFIVVEDKTLKIDPRSIWIPATDHENDMEQIDVLSHEIGLKANADMITGAGLGANYTRKSETTTKQNHKMGGIKTSYQPINKNKPCWILKPHLEGQVLQGGAWEGRKELLKLVDKRTNPKHVLSSVKLIVQCNRKDLDIIDLKYLENKGVFKDFQNKEKEKIAMEMIKNALIKYELSERGLSANDISRDHAVIPLADILVEKE